MRAMFCWLTVCCLAVATAHGEIRVEFAMDHDPEVSAPEPIMIFPENVLSLWLNALARPEAEMQRMAAETIIEAHAFAEQYHRDALPAGQLTGWGDSAAPTRATGLSRWIYWASDSANIAMPFPSLPSKSPTTHF